MNEPAPLNLHDVVLPEPVSWAPQTVGWWVVLAVAGLVLGWAIYAGLRRHRANLYRRLALSRLARIEQALADPQQRAVASAEIPVLVKQTALAFRPRSEVASLTEASWLRFLDETYGGHGFSDGPGRILPALAYRAPSTTAAVPSEELAALVGLVRQWIRRHSAAGRSRVRV